MDDLSVRIVGSPIDRATLDRLWTATQGNALLLRELVLGGLESGTLLETRGVWRWRATALATPRLEEVMRARVGDLTVAERAVLETVAMSEPLEAAFLDALTDAEAREAMERRGLLEIITSGRRRHARLVHPLYAETIRGATPDGTANSIQRRLADLLDATESRRRGDLLRLATWRLTGRGAVDSDLFLAAAIRAMELFDFLTAERLARAVVNVTDSLEAKLVVANAMIGTGRYVEADGLLETAEEAVRTDNERSIVAFRRSLNLYWQLDRVTDARAVLERAEAAVEDTTCRDTLVAANARLQLWSGHTRAAMTTATALLARSGDNKATMMQIAPVLCWGHTVSGHPRQALDIVEELLPVVAKLYGEEELQLTPEYLLGNQAAALIVQGELLDGERSATEAYARSMTSQREPIRGLLGLTLGWARRYLGRPESAILVLEECASLLRDVDPYRRRAATLGELAHCLALVGKIDAAEAALAEADSCTRPSFVMDHFSIEAARAWTKAAGGALSGARDVMRQCVRRSAEYGQTVYEAFAWYDLARLGAPRESDAPLTSLARRVEGPLISAMRDHSHALVRRDSLALQQVSLAFEQMGAVLFAAEARAQAAAILDKTGDTASSGANLARAQHLASVCEGARTPALVDLDLPLPLTKREREVATLAARGRTNRDIAERLYISERTVHNHLHRVFAKLGITRRHDLASILLPNHPTSNP